MVMSNLLVRRLTRLPGQASGLQTLITRRTPTSRCAAPAFPAPPSRAANCRSRSRPGDQTAIEALPGATARMPPPTPLFPGQADAVGEIARTVIVAAHQHQRIDAPRPVARTTAPPVSGLRPPAARNRPGIGELAARHGQRAVVEIDAEHMLDRMIEPAERAHELGQREIAEAGLASPSAPPCGR